MYHYIYKVISENGKYYIGRHSTTKLEDNYTGSGKWVKSLHDKSLLSKEIIQFCDSYDDLLIKEKFYITENINNPLCMNFNNEPIGFATGKLNPACSEHERKRRSARLKLNNPSKDKSVAKKISDALKGKPSALKGIPLSDNARKNMSESRKGIKYSEEGREKLSLARIRDYHSGKRGVPSFTGLKHTDETKSKQSQAALNRKKVKCPHCDKQGVISTMARWHFDNCKVKDNK